MKPRIRRYWIGAPLAVLLLAAGAVLATSQFTSAERSAAPESASGDCVKIPQPPLGDLAGLPIAPDSERVDLCVPSFSNPTEITNPLFPVSDVPSSLQLGTVDGLPFRAEVILLPDTKVIRWNGQRIETRVSQYSAYLDGRIHEVALDFYAQADDGSVWYFGEDVFNYEDGVVADLDGTWLAGKDGPAAMIMPANPQVGDVYRPENAPGFVFEQVVVQAIGETVTGGPRGPVSGAIRVEELHMDGGTEEKTFAPGYGEFTTGSGSNIETVALAVATDALSSPTPVALQTLHSGAGDIFAAGDCGSASATLVTMTSAWAAFQAAGGVPPLLQAQMTDTLGALTAAVAACNPAAMQNAALDTAQASLDLQLRHRPPTEIDLARLDLWVQQLLVDAEAADAGAVAGDATTLEWLRDRVRHTVDPSDARLVDKQLRTIRSAADAEDFAKAADAAEALRDVLADIESEDAASLEVADD